MRAAGGQTLDRGITAQAAREQWMRVEWFKLLLRPDDLAATLGRGPKPKLPSNKRLVDVIADFLRYMVSLVRQHFHSAMDAEGRIWEEMRNRVTHVLSHPNGWNTSQLSTMRQAAIQADLVPDSDQGKDRIVFVSEGEVSLHWCMSKGIGRGDLGVGSQFIVVDAGGGIINISTFKTISTIPLEFEESSIPECYLQGSAFVTKSFRNYVTDKLKGSSFGDSDTIDRLVEDFDLQVKRNFRSVADDLHVRFGRHQDNDPKFGITAGELLVRGERMAQFFEPACHTIDASVKTIVGRGRATVVLVGGFAGNSYLFEEVKRRLSTPNIQVLRTMTQRQKLLRMVLFASIWIGVLKHGWPSGRMGFQTNPVTGKQYIEGGFFVTLKKGTVVHETEFTRFPVWHSQLTQTSTTLGVVIQCYQGDVADIKFRDEDRDERFYNMCWFKVDVPDTSFVRTKQQVTNKEYYYVSNFEIVVSLGATEFKCYVDWKDEKGNTLRDPIAPIWGDVSYIASQVSPPSMTSPGGVSETNLVISLDLGTSYSAASWVLLGDSKEPHIWDVAEEGVPVKVPTVVYYDPTGKLRAVGSETLDKRNMADALEQGWMRVEWPKLLLLPDSLAHQLNRAPKTELPRNKKLVAVIADFLRYMHNLSLKHFYETMGLDGNSSQKMEDRIIYIFSHPNGWNILQHPLMREAAILAGLVPDSDEGNNRIIFVSEAEASLHWCIDRRSAMSDLDVDSNYIVVDAGGGAINISSFRTIGTTPLAFEESSIPQCHLQGSAFVTQAFRKFLQDKLKGSSFGNPYAIELMVKDFDNRAKHGFQDRGKDVFVEFGKPQDNDTRFGISGGQLVVRGADMAGFFEPACSAIVSSVKAIVTPGAKTAVVLVGGFSGSMYLFKEVQRRLEGTQVTRSVDTMVKATAHGAIYFYLKRSVTARMAQWTCGVPCVHSFDRNDSKHVQRQSVVQTNPVTGQRFIEGGFFVTLRKGTAVREADLTRFPFWHSQPERTSTTLNICLECYQGDLLDIKFRDEDGEEQFRELFWFKVVIPETSLVRRVRKEQRKNKQPGNATTYYYVCNFHIVFSFGGPEFKFYIEWKDELRRTHRGPIRPISNRVQVVKIGFD